jgi:hypothetical protein
MSRRMLGAEIPDPVDAEAEEALHKDEQDIGKAWRNVVEPGL